MQIGKPIRTFVVEPLESPVPTVATVPEAHEPETDAPTEPESEPEREPANQ